MCFPEFRQFSDFLQQDFPVVKKRKFSENHIFSVELMHEWHCVSLTKFKVDRRISPHGRGYPKPAFTEFGSAK